MRYESRRACLAAVARLPTWTRTVLDRGTKNWPQAGVRTAPRCIQNSNAIRCAVRARGERLDSRLADLREEPRTEPKERGHQTCIVLTRAGPALMNEARTDRIALCRGETHTATEI